VKPALKNLQQIIQTITQLHTDEGKIIVYKVINCVFTLIGYSETLFFNLDEYFENKNSYFYVYIYSY